MEEFNNYDIIILPDSIKKDIIEKISINNIYKYKILSLSELITNYFFNYSEETVFYLYNKYSLCPDVARIYLDNLVYVYKDDKVNSPKVDYLKRLKKELDENKLLEYNDVFIDYLKDKKILAYKCNFIDNFYYKIFDEISKYSTFTYYNEQDLLFNKKTIYKFQNKDDEIIFIAEKIIDLVEQNIDLNNIYLVNVKKEYYYMIDKIFNIFNIPIELDTESSISGTNIVKVFKENFVSDVNLAIQKIEEILNEKNKYIYENIINIINSYSFLNDIREAKELIFSKIDNIKLKPLKYDHSVKVKDIDYPFNKDTDFIFICNFNEGVIPSNIMDEDYLSDKIKLELGMSDSVDLNRKNRNKILNKIMELSNITITYAARNLSGELYISSLYSDELFDIQEGCISYEYSHPLNKLKLVSYKDLNRKYGTISNDLLLLSTNYKNENYMTYNNKYKGIDLSTYKNYFPGKITLSYTSINSYYECAFKYYLQYILKIDKYENTFEAQIGTIFHDVLAKCYNASFNLDDEFLNSCNKNSDTYTFKELFFLDKLKDELKYTINILMQQKKLTALNKAFFEKKILISVDDFTQFKGFVDKVFYDYVGNDLVLMIVDYKTGNADINLNYLKFGLNMQLPIYVYLFKNYKHENYNIKIGGFYLQKIINNISNPDEKEKSFRLQGYSNSNTNILKFIDKSYENSSLIKGLKTKTDGFYSFSKVINDEKIDEMINDVDIKISSASKDIRNANFQINPKEIDGKLVGCSYCKFKDICYRKNDDIIKLKSAEVEENGMDE